ncbi:MAG: molybdopterin-binding protein, partial [Candidatus Dormibacteraeota bacterium]|nr:molybdopterin-binding protein [Candidatus Dormibacteraeota bacterium]
VHIVADVQEEIVVALRAEIQRGPDCLFLCGGLGPTPDDRTLAALSVAIERPLRLDPQAAKRIQDRIDWLHGIGRIASNEMREANRRMAAVPEGAVILNNSMGMAPGLVFPISGPGEVESRHLFVLPGVPRELKTIFEEEIVTGYLAGGTVHLTEEVHFQMAVEAEFWDILSRVEREFPGLSVGSYPQPDRGHLIIRLAGPDPLQVTAAADLVRASAPAEPYSAPAS